LGAVKFTVNVVTPPAATGWDAEGVMLVRVRKAGVPLNDNVYVPGSTENEPVPLPLKTVGPFSTKFASDPDGTPSTTTLTWIVPYVGGTARPVPARGTE
jgi:hypothetical protein